MLNYGLPPSTPDMATPRPPMMAAGVQETTREGPTDGWYTSAGAAKRDPLIPILFWKPAKADSIIALKERLADDLITSFSAQNQKVCAVEAPRHVCIV